MRVKRFWYISDPEEIPAWYDIQDYDEFYNSWCFVDYDNKITKMSQFPILCDCVGETMYDGDNSFWDFSQERYCPIKINGLWGFIDETLKIICTPKFENVGFDRDIKCGGCHVPPLYLHQTLWINNRTFVQLEGNEVFIDRNFNVDTYYERLSSLNDLTCKDIIKLSINFIPKQYIECPWKYTDAKDRTLRNGTAVLETEEQCNAYLAAYGSMHYKKLLRAFNDDEFPYYMIAKGVEIYDWGCGQGIGTVTLIEKLREKGLLSCIKKITLEEPSDIARSRAVIHIRQALGNNINKDFAYCFSYGNINIKEESAYLPSDYGDNRNSISSINVEQPCAIHIFSNILDIETVSLKKVSQLISSSGQQHIVLCVGPANLNESRILSFKNYFKDGSIKVFTNFRDTNFGRHPNGKIYGCLINSFTYTLSEPKSVLHKYKYFAPIQLFAAYCDNVNHLNILEAAFEILAPFDMTVHQNIHPVYALISNIISRGCPTLASENVLNALSNHPTEQKEKELKTIARIHKVFIEALISGRLSISQNEWKILIIEDGTDVSNIAVKDFVEMYSNLTAMTENYDNMQLPEIRILKAAYANVNDVYDMIIDVSVDKHSDSEHVAFSKYKAKNDCYFNVRSSEYVHEPRTLYTTERIKYKSFVEKDISGRYIVNEETTSHLRYFLNLIFRKDDFRPGQLPILSRALSLKSVIGLLPTGGGKSLTYQLAAMLQPAVTLVVDPLKGLMKDQYDGLIKTGIDCISYINSDITSNKEEAHKREQALTGSQIQIMFLSPERLSIYRFREVLRSMRESGVYFSYGVIDEVHCVSEWGHDFRLAYLHLGRNLYNYVLPKEVEGADNHITLFGLTATASFDVLADVERELSGRNSYSLEDDATVRYENTNRLELQYNVYPVDASNAIDEWGVSDIKENLLSKVIVETTKCLEEIQEENSINTIKKRFLERENISSEEMCKKIQNSDIKVKIEKNWWNSSKTETASIIFCPRADSCSGGVPNVTKKLSNKGLKYTLIPQHFDLTLFISS